MITIYKGSHKLQVSEDTYKTMFERMGYLILEEKAEVSKETSAHKKENASNIDKNKKIDTFLDDVTNLSSEDKKDVKNDSDDKEKVSKEDSKEDKIDDILGIISETAKEEKKKNK